jgi:hypothetical protein
LVSPKFEIQNGSRFRRGNDRIFPPVRSIPEFPVSWGIYARGPLCRFGKLASDRCRLHYIELVRVVRRSDQGGKNSVASEGIGK